MMQGTRIYNEYSYQIGDLVRITFYPEERIGIVIKSSESEIEKTILESSSGIVRLFHWTWLKKI